MASRWDTLDLGEIERRIWRALTAAVGRPKDPWRTPVLVTCGDGEGRVVVLRAVDGVGREIEFHTDARSPKVRALERDPRVTWVFYSPRWQVQLRIRAVARVHVGDEAAEAAWGRVPAASRSNYADGPAPGVVVSAPLDAADFRGGIQAHFARVQTRVDRVDWLWLRPGGHRRAVWESDADGWAGGWRAP
jgi:pyridoxamine 5'-phosphate oxidase